MYARRFKRLIDVTASGIVLFLLSPLLAVVGLAIRIEDGSPVIYTQERTGRCGERFTILKFRSMSKDSELVPSRSAGANRVTRVGRALRRSNIDEIPQLLNVLRGDMSLVGPRPPLDSQVALIEMRKAGRAIEVRPGLTGLAQVNSFDAMPETTKARYDNEYAANITFLGDVKIVLQTVWYLFRPPPVY